MSLMRHEFPSFETALKAHYASKRIALGLRQARPFYRRPPPPAVVPDGAPGSDLLIGPLMPRTAVARAPTVSERIQRIAYLVVSRSIRFPMEKRSRQFGVCAASAFGVKAEEIFSERRSRHIVDPRQVAMTMAYLYTPSSLPDIGRTFDRDHTTVLHAVRKWTPAVRAAVEAVTSLRPLKMPSEPAALPPPAAPLLLTFNPSGGERGN